MPPCCSAIHRAMAIRDLHPRSPPERGRRGRSVQTPVRDPRPGPDAVRDEFVHVEGTISQLASGRVRAGKQHHVFDQQTEAGAVFVDDGERFAIFALVVGLALQRDFRGGLSDGHGRPQLMRGIGHELTLRLARRRRRRCR